MERPGLLNLGQLGSSACRRSVRSEAKRQYLVTTRSDGRHGKDMSRICGYVETTTGHPCENVVEDFEDHCRANHPCSILASDTDTSDRTDSNAMALSFEIEELSNSSVPAWEKSPGMKSLTTRHGMLTDEVVRHFWDSFGCTDPALARALHRQGLRPDETTRLVISNNGQPTSILKALQSGEIPIDEAWIVCATRPGAGWRYNSDRFLWERSLPVRVL